jgi:hypothetical protein
MTNPAARTFCRTEWIAESLQHSAVIYDIGVALASLFIFFVVGEMHQIRVRSLAYGQHKACANGTQFPPELSQRFSFSSIWVLYIS